MVGIGDAENDRAFLELCRASAVVSNAVPELKQAADVIACGESGRGATEIIDRIINREIV